MSSCVCCGEYVPEGRQVCPICEKGAREMAELEHCEYCGEKPDLQKGIEFTSFMEKYRYHCPRCNIQSKPAYTIEGAIEAWNRRAEDGK